MQARLQLVQQVLAIEMGVLGLYDKLWLHL
jgi:hypothetical protein